MTNGKGRLDGLDMFGGKRECQENMQGTSRWKEKTWTSQVDTVSGHVRHVVLSVGFPPRRRGFHSMLAMSFITVQVGEI